MRESPSLELIKLLNEKGAAVDYSDPYVPEMPKTRKHNFGKESIPLSENILQDYDCVVIATNHDKFDYDLIRDNSELIVDTRNCYSTAHAHVVKA